MESSNEKTVISKKRSISNATIHHIPCEIKYDGNAPISNYFVVNEDNKVKEAMFHGRLLKGEREPIEKGITGMMICKNERAGKSEYEIGATFDEVTEWFTDNIPKEKDHNTIGDCIEWMNVVDKINAME